MTVLANVLFFSIRLALKVSSLTFSALGLKLLLALCSLSLIWSYLNFNLASIRSMASLYIFSFRFRKFFFLYLRNESFSVPHIPTT